MIMSYRNVLILQTVITHYRVPLFNFIGKHPGIRLTVAYDKNMERANCRLEPAKMAFDVIAYEKGKFLGPLQRIRDLRSLIAGYDVVIFQGDLHLVVPILSSLVRSKRQKVYCWGIGLSSSNGLRERPLADKIRYWLNDWSDGTILYSSHVAEIYRRRVSRPNKVFVAHNSIEVQHFPFSEEKRTRIVSLGTFKKNKRLQDLVTAFANIIDRIPEDITLDFIGDGEDGPLLQQMVQERGLTARVNFHGRIEDDQHIWPILKNALVSVSPTQAGLSVLHAMAMGCPFLTSVNAVTGGEKFNITDNRTGYYYNGEINDLENKLLQIIRDPLANQRVAYNAYVYYHGKRRVEQMAQSLIEVILQE